MWALILIIMAGSLVFDRSGDSVESLPGVINDCLSFGGKGGGINKAVVLLENGKTVRVMTNSCFNCVGKLVTVHKKHTIFTGSVFYDF